MKRLTLLLIALAIPFSTAYACTAFLTGERTSGMNKICYYDHLGDDAAITVSAVDLCPLTIKVKH